MTDTDTHNVLLIEDSPSYAQLVTRALQGDDVPAPRRLEPRPADDAAGPSRGSARSPFRVAHSPRLEAGLAHLAARPTDLVLLDLNLPGCRGLDALARLRLEAPDVPVVVVTGHADDATALQVVRSGAQDCLDKAVVDARGLRRSAEHAIERHQLLRSLRAQSLVDDLTGLANRRAFLQQAELRMAAASRSGRGFVLAMADVDDLKLVNDRMGHAAGDAVLRASAATLSAMFRRTDLVARLGGDEFAAMTDEPMGDAASACTALRERLRGRAASLGRPLHLSLGAAVYDPARPCSVDELLAEADGRMYRDKRDRAAGPLRRSLRLS